MPIPTPFHPRTSKLCTSLFWKEWAGFHAVCSYDTCHEREYYAIRHAAGMIDVSPLQKYDVHGPDAAALLSQITVKNIDKLRVGRVTYLCWCDDDGKVLDDGVVARLDEDYFRVTSNGPSLAWFQKHAQPLRAEVKDTTESVGVLAVQGPTSRQILQQACDADLKRLRFFRSTRARIDGIDVWISRTGYTGDLGYEVSVDRAHALEVWDALIAAGRAYRLQPAGLNAMDVTRIEAGFILHGVDYFSARQCLIESRKSSPYEIGLGRIVQLDRDPFIGQAALAKEKKSGSVWTTMGLEYDWDEYEALHARFGLPPSAPSAAWRAAVPVYDRNGRQVGQATSGAWSPILKKNLAIACLKTAHARPGDRLSVEVTVEYERHKVSARVVPLPFFDPERKRV